MLLVSGIGQERVIICSIFSIMICLYLVKCLLVIAPWYSKTIAELCVEQQSPTHSLFWLLHCLSFCEFTTSDWLHIWYL